LCSFLHSLVSKNQNFFFLICSSFKMIQ
jgi:hypothetical protein